MFLHLASLLCYFLGASVFCKYCLSLRHYIFPRCFDSLRLDCKIHICFFFKIYLYSSSIWVKLLCRSVSHSFAVVYLYYTYKDSFNIFFNGISYVIQFSIFTLFLAVPRFPIQTYIYVIFITSFILYVFRFVSKFTKLYTSLLETILSIQNQNEIQIKTFDKIVAKHFLSIMNFFSCL